MVLEYLPSILVVVAFVAVCVYLWRNNNRELVSKMILSLVVQAEKTLGSGTGDLKYALVVDGVYTKLPRIITLLYSKRDIDKMIQSGVSKLKEMLDSGVSLTSYDDEFYLKYIA